MRVWSPNLKMAPNAPRSASLSGDVLKRACAGPPGAEVDVYGKSVARNGLSMMSASTSLL